MLDRVDSLCYAAPIFFHYVRYFYYRTERGSAEHFCVFEGPPRLLSLCASAVEQAFGSKQMENDQISEAGITTKMPPMNESGQALKPPLTVRNLIQMIFFALVIRPFLALFIGLRVRGEGTSPGPAHSF